MAHTQLGHVEHNSFRCSLSRRRSKSIQFNIRITTTSRGYEMQKLVQGSRLTSNIFIKHCSIHLQQFNDNLTVVVSIALSVNLMEHAITPFINCRFISNTIIIWIMILKVSAAVLADPSKYN